MQEMRVQSLGQGRFSAEGNGNPLQYFCLENSMNRAWRATVRRVAKSRTQLSTAPPPPHLYSYTIGNQKVVSDHEIILEYSETNSIELECFIWWFIKPDSFVWFYESNSLPDSFLVCSPEQCSLLCIAYRSAEWTMWWLIFVSTWLGHGTLIFGQTF